LWREIFDLKWSDVDLKTKLIKVQKSKTGKQRVIGINEILSETLRTLPSRLKKGLEKAEIEDFRFHDLRHTFASHLVINGVDIRTVSELMGHSSIIMTMKCAHLAPNSQLHAVQRLPFAYQTVPLEISGDQESS